MSRESRQLLVVVLALVAIGLAFLLSASAVSSAAGRGDAFHFLKRQLLWAGLGLAGMLACRRLDPERWGRWGAGLHLLTIAGLVLCFVPGIGAQLNGAHRWLRLGGWFVQPSEAAKLTLAFLVCGWMARDPGRLASFTRGFLPGFGAVALTCGLIVVEPDLGTAAFVGLVMTTTMVVGGARLRHLLPPGILAAAAGGLYAAAHFEHVRDRVETWLHPERDPFGKGHQIQQSLIALGSGGWFGEGLGRGRGKLSYLPEVHSDFIFPLIGEELGFVGAAAILLLFAALALAGWRVMRKAPTPFGALLSFTVTLTIILQAAMNVAVVTAAMPTKGIPLPFLSAGGSSLCFTMCGVGILMAVADRAERREGSCALSSRAGEPAAISSPASLSPSTC